MNVDVFTGAATQIENYVTSEKQRVSNTPLPGRRSADLKHNRSRLRVGTYICIGMYNVIFLKNRYVF